MAFSLFFQNLQAFPYPFNAPFASYYPYAYTIRSNPTCPEFISLSQALAKGFHSHLPHTFSLSNIKLILTIFQHSQTNIWINILSCQHISPPIIASYQSIQHTQNFMHTLLFNFYTNKKNPATALEIIKYQTNRKKLSTVNNFLPFV